MWFGEQRNLIGNAQKIGMKAILAINQANARNIERAHIAQELQTANCLMCVS